MIKTAYIKIDAKGKILGRIATEVCNKLRGKDDPTFTYNTVKPIKVTVYNAKDILVSGNKAKQKKYYRHSGYLGNLKEISYSHIMSKDPSKIIFMAIRNMLPANRLRQKWLNNLTILNGELDAKD